MNTEMSFSSQHSTVGCGPRRLAAAIAACALLTAGLVGPSAASASLTDAEIRDQIEQTRRVDPGVLDQIETMGHAAVMISLALLDQPSERAAGEVDPTIVELVHRLLPGEAHLPRADVLAGLVDAPSLLAIVRHPAVLGVQLDLSPGAGRAEPEGENLASCVANSTTACLSGNFQVRINGPFGPAATVGAFSKLSATFGFFGSTSNWEVLVKVLNGCAINNHYWVFAGDATSQSYSISVVNKNNGDARIYGPSCPLTDTTAFPCS